jgi:hypothetical protein
MIEQFGPDITHEEIETEANKMLDKNPRELALIYLSVLYTIFAQAVEEDLDPFDIIDEAHEEAKSRILETYSSEEDEEEKQPELKN